MIKRYTNKILLWLATIIQCAQTLYPGFDGEMLVTSWNDNTIWVGAFNIFTTLVLTHAAIRLKVPPK